MEGYYKNLEATAEVTLVCMGTIPAALEILDE